MKVRKNKFHYFEISKIQKLMFSHILFLENFDIFDIFPGCQDLHPGTIQGIKLHINKLFSPRSIFSVFFIFFLDFSDLFRLPEQYLKYIFFFYSTLPCEKINKSVIWIFFTVIGPKGPPKGVSSFHRDKSLTQA